VRSWPSWDYLAEKVVQFAATAKVGNGLEDGFTMGPVQNRPQYERVTALIEDCEAQGYGFLLKPEIPEGPGYFVPPTIVDNPPEDSAIVREEPFGPVVPFLRYTSGADVLDHVTPTSTAGPRPRRCSAGICRRAMW
jgi:acyl-CoA reductase-like NAD-dependent aldehyde dehydrogenase